MTSKEGYCLTPHPKWLVTILFLAVFLGALDIAIVSPVLPELKTFFRIGDRLVVWMFSIYILFNLIGNPLMAYLAGLAGRRSVFAAGVGLFGLGSLIVALSPDFSVILIGRSLQGLGAGGLYPIANAVIGDLLPPREQGRALGVLSASLGVALLLGPVLAGLMLRLHWRWLFVLNIPIALVVIWGSMRLIPKQKLASAVSMDWRGLGLFMLLLPCLAVGLNQINPLGLPGSLLAHNVWPFLLAAVILIPLLLMVERRAPAPVLKAGLFNSRQLKLVYVIGFCTGLSQSCLTFVPMMAVVSLGLTSSTASFMLLPGVVAVTVGSILVGRMLDHAGSKIVIAIGAVVLMAGMLCLNLFPQWLGAFIAAAVMIGLGLAAVSGPTPGYIVLNESAPLERPLAQGMVTLFTSIGMLIGSVLVGAIANSFNDPEAGYRRAYLGGAAAALFIFIAVWGLKKRREEVDRQSAVFEAEP
jgi:MFS family permease